MNLLCRLITHLIIFLLLQFTPYHSSLPRFEVQPWTSHGQRSGRTRESASGGGLGLGLGLSSKSPSPTRSQSQSDMENFDSGQGQGQGQGSSSKDQPLTFLDNGVVRSTATAVSHHRTGSSSSTADQSQSQSRQQSRLHPRSHSQSHLPATFSEGGPRADGANATIIPGPLVRRAVSASVQQGTHPHPHTRPQYPHHSPSHPCPRYRLIPCVLSPSAPYCNTRPPNAYPILK